MKYTEPFPLIALENVFSEPSWNSNVAVTLVGPLPGLFLVAPWTSSAKEFTLSDRASSPKTKLTASKKFDLPNNK